MKNLNASMLEHFASPWNVVYSAKDLAENPAGPRTRINGTGPFIFVEHVRGSHVSGRINGSYFKQGLPYLDGWKGVFTLQAAAMLNAVQGGQVLGEFRGISPAERDRLVQAMGDKDSDRGIELDAQSPRLLSTWKKSHSTTCGSAAPCCMAIDRWGGSQGLSRISTLRAVGGRDPARLAVRDAGSRSWSNFPVFRRTSRSLARKPRSCWQMPACRT